ncbi:MAG: D-isomer specific 2-hydroxyacid dehydrogenase family protein [Actinomycetota bacterium]|nr:D-isomer specific 2-hydroxyacid dehydrogenase family protein [Actinomycetota bacterium]MDQ6945698.1 D-isomer specific 2-hydroxyacid dehydrogenase family protein [Actinomycetota bacterium]
MSLRPAIAVLPTAGGPWAEAAVAAVVAGGGVVVDPPEAEALVWTETRMDPAVAVRLAAILRRNPGIRWVQLPWAGVEQYAALNVFDHHHLWTSAKGLYARPVAEHALTLTLAGLRHVKGYSRAERWSAQAGRTLFDGHVTIFGGGGIAQDLVRLLAPFCCQVTVVRKRPDPMEGAQVLGWDLREQALPGADAVILALALTDENTHFFRRRQFEAMEAHACLVNVARGRHIVTDDLVAALQSGQIGAAGLDVTDPEPLPEGHPLWALDNCLITPHTANTQAMAIPVLSGRIAANVRRFAAGEPLLGLVDPDLGY